MDNYLAKLVWKVVADWDNQLLRLFLRERCQISKRALADIKFNNGLILLNNKEVTVRAIVKKGDEVQIYLPSEQVSASVKPEYHPLSISYEDEHLLVINKKAGMPTIPSREHPGGTLANAVVGYFQEKNHQATFHAVNRLDKDTSGLLIIAKHRLAHDRFSKMQQEGKVKRYYKAIVTGFLKRGEGTINAPIERDPNSIIARQVRMDGKEAITHYRAQVRTSKFSVVEIRLETGRTHQIRVHFSYIGHPLLGDDLYGGSTAMISRQALHCHKVEFEHPFQQSVMTIQEEIPEDMKCIGNEGEQI
ncbi:RluA family pseudouridine synthase [Halalkalibacter krulwichiae]|uniref:Pseudouridine synthase n=1 Tax=Halalkalibacter krulwichiae TaxID=199441 RepID=A0A1X9MG01_9BACI|nr:RluA family pseudouridine synthase [Halalkalibacter krulwichiae]ARK31450.1 Ribosomal large subunit pseudouridine synthase D [Halalkalibacter krulwichiae]